MSDPAPRPDRPALGAALFCYVFWGLVPLLFQAIGHAGGSSWEIVAWRTALAAPVAAAIVWLAGKPAALRALDPRTIGWLCVSALAIGINWAVYVWAVNAGHTLETSLGYYLNPLANVAAGLLVFRERVSRAGWIAIGLACAGVALQAYSLGGLPWVSLVLAIAFAAYGVIRKRVAADAFTGLLVECLALGLPGLLYVIWLERMGQGHFGHGALVTGLFLLSGPATVLPLAAFAWAARRLPLSLMGFIQFVSPTITFVIGVVEGEKLGLMGLLSFGFIWAGVAVFSLDAFRRSRAPRLAAA